MNELLEEKTSKSCTTELSTLAPNKSSHTEPFSEQNPFVLCFIGGLFSHLHGDCIEFFKAVSQIRQKIPWFEFHLYEEATD